MKILLTLLGVGSAAAQDSGSGANAFLPEGGLIPKCIADPELVRTAGASCITDSITHFTSILLFGVAIGSFVYLLYGAFLYSTAFGDEKKVEQGKKSITYALIGVIVATLAFVIVRLLQNILNAPWTNP